MKYIVDIYHSIKSRILEKYIEISSTNDEKKIICNYEIHCYIYHSIRYFHRLDIFLIVGYFGGVYIFLFITDKNIFNKKSLLEDTLQCIQCAKPIWFTNTTCKGIKSMSGKFLLNINL